MLQGVYLYSNLNKGKTIKGTKLKSWATHEPSGTSDLLLLRIIFIVILSTFLMILIIIHITTRAEARDHINKREVNVTPVFYSCFSPSCILL